MSQIPIFTIGYGTRDITEFVKVLKTFKIQFLLDVRSKPYSRYKPDFSKNNLDSHLLEHTIRYVFMGNNLGGLPVDPHCYTADGKVDYEKYEKTPLYRTGIKRLRDAWTKQLRVAIMCSEGKPENCHRSKLIGKTLESEKIPVAHIDENNLIISQEDVIVRINKGQLRLFIDCPLDP